ncbi:uncharacterized protein AKAME5_000389600 [Lates japonicus]|uniref:Uncharacterized protein n=1 Tax=Lates japonicus TaxID=270547 RepID=A0AAD3R071_LATJO|nr:uncharacterized protein AKAME5_000389600 [Lates japonicus]
MRSVFVILGLLVCKEAPGSSDVTSLFVQRGKDLLLENLQQDDTGYYVALVIGAEERKAAEYNVIVQEPVSPVYFIVNSSSSDKCNFTVSCETRDSHISKTFRCDDQSCSEKREEETTTYPSFINVYVDQGFITCNHSNKVSLEQARKEISSVCGEAPGSENLSAGISLCLVKTVVFSVGLIIMVSAVISVHLMNSLKKQK